MTVRQERRPFGRRETSVLAWIRIDGRPKLRCCVRNVTPIGAFLELTPPLWLPFKFTLEQEPTGTLLGCEIRHTTPTGIVVQFVLVETVAEYRAIAADSGIEEEEWRGNLRLSNDRKALGDDHAGGRSLVARVRASTGTKR